MFFHDKLDPAWAEFLRRFVDQGPGPLTKPVPDIEQIRSELAAEAKRRERAVLLTKAGFWPIARDLLARAGDPSNEAATAEADPPPTSAGTPSEQVQLECTLGDYEATDRTAEGDRTSQSDRVAPDLTEMGDSDFFPVPPDRTIKGPDRCSDVAPSIVVSAALKAQPARCDLKATLSKSKADFEAIADASRSEPQARPAVSSLVGKGELTRSPRSGRKRAHPDDVPWHKKRFIQGHKKTKSISKKRRDEADDAFLRWKVLGAKWIVAITLAPDLDHLRPVERMEYWPYFVNLYRSYRRERCKTLRKPLTWWPARAITVRESDPDTHMGEHLHGIFHMPNRAEADRFIDVVMGVGKFKGWGKNSHAMRVDANEVMVGGKRSSFLNYLLKAANPQSRWDSTVGWKKSGTLIGERVFITTNLTNSKAVAETAVGVATLKRVREEKKRAAFVRRARSQARYSWG